MKKEKRSFLKVRVFLVFFFFLAFFSAIFLRAFQLQVIDSAKLKKIASSQHLRTINIQSKRGEIYDRNLRELAVSLEVASIYAQPEKIKRPVAAARRLSRVLKVSAGSIKSKLKSKRNFVWLRRQVDLDEKEMEEIRAMDGVGIINESRRYYPNRELASNLIGFMGVDSVGLEGVERYYDDFLDGMSRKVVGGRDAAGRLILYGDTDREVPLEGMSVELTIDKTIQYIAEKALKNAVEKHGASGGMAVVMSPKTGEILAMANMPTFDPNRFRKYSAASWRNKAVTDAFEPGSVLKVFLAAGAIEEGVVKPNDIFFCENGSFRVADRVFHDHTKHGWLSVSQIIKYSSNIGALKIGEKLGEKRLYRVFKNFGFGDKTGVDLPGETSGSLRDYRDWSGVTLYTMSFGQGISSSAVQLVTAMSAVANGGYLMKPYAVKEIKGADGGVIKENHPVIVRRVISSETARTITGILKGVVGPGGTGEKGAVEGFSVAGKTATAQKPDFKKGGYLKNSYMASFLGYVPADDPALAVLVVIDSPKGLDYYGGTVAAPVFSEIASRSLSYLGIFADSPEGEASEASVRSSGPVKKTLKLTRVKTTKRGAGLVPDYRGKTVRKVLSMAMEDSLDVDVIGGGVAVRQRPAAGRKIGRKGVVSVWFQ